MSNTVQDSDLDTTSSAISPIAPIASEKSILHEQDYNLLKLVLDNIPQYVFWKDTQSVYLGCNQIFSDIAGLREPKEINGLTDFDLPWKKKEAEFFRLCDERVIEYDRAEYDIIESQRRSDGNNRWVKTNKIPLHDNQGKVIGILGTGEDITEQIKAEERLKYYEIIASTIDDMMAIIDGNMRFLAVNDAFSRAYGETRETIIGSHIKDFTDKELFDQLLKPNIEKVLSGKITRFEGWRMFSDMERRYIQYSYYPILDGKDKATSFVAQLIDITETKRLETQLYQAQKMEAIGQLTGGIAHDFNNILSVINGYSELTLITMPADDPNRKRIEEISSAGNRAARLTQQLLAFSKRQLIKPCPLNLSDEIKEFNRMLERLLGEHIDIEIKADSDLWLAQMDRSQFEQVILNLTVNARDAIQGKGSVTITISNHTIDTDFEIDEYAVLAGEYVELLFSDTGHGMSAKIQARIFEPFFSTKPKEAGTGLGLSTVYGIIKQNKGYISVASEINSGTVFKLLLPRSVDNKVTEKNLIIHALGDLAGGSETILLVEDDKKLRLMCASILKELGYTVIEAENGRDALDRAGKCNEEIDLLVTDVVMPRLGGAELAALLKKAQPDLKVLFMSGYTEDSISKQCVLNENINFIQKPVTPKTLSLEVRKALQ